MNFRKTFEQMCILLTHVLKFKTIYLVQNPDIKKIRCVFLPREQNDVTQRAIEYDESKPHELTEKPTTKCAEQLKLGKKPNSTKHLERMKQL